MYKESWEAAVAALEKAILQIERGALARRSLEEFGAVILARDAEEACRLTDEIAPEHLHIATENAAALAENPHLRFGNGDKRGYVKIELDRETCTAIVRTLDDVRRVDSGISTLATFAVQNGRPGAQQT